MRRREGCETFNHGEEGRRGCGLALHHRAVTRQHHDLGNLGGIIGVLPDPSALRVTGAERLLHRDAERFSVYRFARLKIWK